MLFVDISVRKNDIVYAFINTCLSLLAQVVESLAQAVLTFRYLKHYRQLLSVEAFIADIAEYIELCICQHRLRQAHHLAVRCIWRQNICTHGTDVFRQRHHQFFADRVDGRVCHLCKLLTEIVEQHLRTVRDDSQRSVVTHSSNRLLTGSGHRNDCLVNILLTISELYQLTLKVAHRIIYLTAALQFFQLHTVFVEPFTIWMCLRQLLLYLAVIIYLSLLRVDKKNLSGLQTSFADDILRFEIHHAHF